jgi:Flp pilus assembly protein TadD
MSLLLEALKKAEKAKEEAQRRSRGDGAPAEPAPPPAEPEPLAEPAPLIARDELPEVRQPLALEDEPPPAPKAAPAPPPPPRRAEPRPDPQAGEREAQRNSARKVFEAKFKEPNPRLPFFITLGALGVFAVGTVIYFWLQLRPAPALANTNPPRPSNETQIAAADLKPTPTVVPSAPASAIPGLPASATPAAPAPAPLKPAVQLPIAPVTPPVAALRPPEKPLIPAPPRPAVPARPAAPAEISTTRQAPQVHPNIATGYAAYLAGDLATARTEYEKALKEEPANRDALLGLAALDVRAARFESAEAAYLRLLQADPRDSHAAAALLALRAGRGDPVNAESRVKTMLADAPGAHVLNFTLGNQLAQQGRWAEAQQEYFKAFAAEPDNADFAYNLAVSLDHLRQPKLALEYYQRAIALAKARGARFDLAAAEARAAQLSR